MPNNDLGTAHGRIRVDYDGKGSAAATAALIKMQKQFEEMNQKLSKIEKALTDADSGMEALGKSAERTEKATRGFSSSLFDSHKNMSQFVKDSRDMTNDLKQLTHVAERGKRAFDHLSAAVKVFNGAGEQTNTRNVFRSLSISMAALRSQTEGVTKNVMNAEQRLFSFFRQGDRLLGMRSGFALLSAGVMGVKDRVIGLNQALNQSPSWVRKLSNFTISVTAAGTAFKFLGKAMTPLKYLDKLTTSKAFFGIVKGSDKAADAFSRLGNMSQRIFGRNLFGGLVTNLRDADRGMTGFLSRTAIGSVKLQSSVAGLSEKLFKFGSDSKSLVGSIALLSGSIGNLWHRFQWFFKLPKPLLAGFMLMISRILPTALNALGVALRGTSNLVVGLWDGIKQLGGGLTVIPGLIATILTGVTALIPVFKGLKDQFKDVFSDDPAKAAEAFAKLPEHLKPMAKALKDVVPQWKELQKTLQTVAFDQIEKQISSLASNYFPIFESGSKSVILSVRKMKDEFVDFMLQTQTKQDVSSLYSNTASALSNLASATRPAAEGLRNMAVVGNQFIADMSGFAPVLAQQFQAWSQLNRGNGNMRKWMDDSAHGVYNLVKGLKDAVAVAYNFLGLFKSNSGEGWLQRFANYMEQINAKSKESSISGWLNNLRNGVKNMGADKWEEMKSLFKIFGDTIKGVAPFVQTLSDSFSSKFVPALKASLWITSQFLNIVNDLGATHFLGWILGVYLGLKVLPKTFATIIDSGRGLVGVIGLLANKNKVIDALGAAWNVAATKISTFGSAGERVAQGMVNVGGAVDKTIGVIGKLVAGLTIATAVFAFFWSVFSTNKEVSNDLKNSLEENIKQLDKFKLSLQDAFKNDGGVQGKNVLDAVSENLNSKMTELQTQADRAPGIWKHITDSFNTNRDNGFFNESHDINDLQELTTQADLASKGFKRLRDAGYDLASVVSSSDSAFQDQIARFRMMGDEGNAASDVLEEQRATLEGLKQNYADAGPAAVMLADGMEQMAAAGGDATSKLSALKKILEALGILKTSSLDAIRDYESAIMDLGDEVAKITHSADFSSSQLINGDTFALGTRNGIAFYDTMKNLGSAFMSAVSAGTNADEAYQKFLTSLKVVQQETGLTEDVLKGLAAQVGVSPEWAKISLQLVGKDEVTVGLAAVMSQMTIAAKDGVKIPVTVSSDQIPLKNVQAVKDKIDSILGKGVVRTNGTNLIINPVADQGMLDKLKATLNELGVNFGDIGGTGAATATLPVSIVPVPSPELKDSNGENIIHVGSLGDLLGITQMDPSEAITQDQLNAMIAPLDDMQDDFAKSGGILVDKLAEGIRSNPAADNAMSTLAGSLRGFLHNSPPKKGPLAKHGDAALFGGKVLVESYAEGIISKTGQVNAAMSNVAGAASDGVNGSSIKNDKNYQAGQFLGQVTSMVSFAQHAVEAFSKLSETLFSAAKFASDPLGKGTFFGKRMAYQRDPNVTDLMIKQRKADDAQQRVLDFRGSGQYPQNDGKPTGDLGTLTPGAGKQEIANYIIDKALSLGYSKAQADQFLIQAVGESGLSPTANGGNQGSGAVTGIFQFDQQTWELATGKTDQVVDPSAPADPNKKKPSQKQQEKKTKEEIDRFLAEANDPAKNIEAYFNLAAQRLLNPDNLKDGSQLGSQVSIGGPWHPENQAKGHLSRAQAEAQQYLQNYTPNAGQLSSGITPGLPQNIANAVGGGPNILIDSGHVTSSSASKLTAALIAKNFPEIQRIGGSYLPISEGGPSVAGTHDAGKSIDINIPNWNTPAGKALGDRINNWLQSNAQALGIGATIWQDTWKRASDGLIGADRQPGHLDHIDVNFPTGLPGVNPDGTINLSVPTGSSGTRDRYAPPKPPEDTGVVAPRNLVTINPDGSFTPVPDTSKPDSVPINKATGKPWTAEEAAAYWGLPENAKQYDASKIQPGDPNTPGVFNGTPEELAALTETLDPALQGILTNTNGLPDMSTDQAIATATAIRDQIDTLSTVDTPQARAQTSILQGKLGEITSQNGLAETQNPIDQAAAIGGSLSSIAGDIFGAINSGIESVGATKNIADTMVRGIANTEDVFNIVDQVQTYFGFIADIAGAVGSISGGVGAIVGAAGGADPSGGAGAAATALQAVSQIAGLVQSAWETVNAVIDLGQEAYRIVGSYFGQFLGMLTGGPEGALMGNVKFLLDEQVGQLLAYSQDNPTDKRAHDLAYQKSDLSSRNQTIGNINVYGGPGSDPRDNTRQMMFQVKASSMGQATGQ